MSSGPGASLPPDGGWGWMIVFGTFIIHFIFDGIFYSFGILFAEFVDYFHTSQSETSFIDSLAMAIPFLIGPFASILTNKFGCRIVAIIGSLILSSGFILTYFTPNLYFMYFSLGILPGLGYGMIYLPSIVILNQYFEKRRAFAVGVAVSGAGIGTFAFSPLIKTLIGMYSWRGTMLVLSGVTLNCFVCGALFQPLPELTKNIQPIARSGKPSKRDSVTVDPANITPENACNDNVFTACPKVMKVPLMHSNEASIGITSDDVDKVHTISFGKCNTSSVQDNHLACPKKVGSHVDLFDGYSETILMEDMKKPYNISLIRCNMSANRQEVVPEHISNQQNAKKKEIDEGFDKFARNSNYSQDEYIHGAASMLQSITVLPDATSDQSNINQNGQKIYSSSNKQYANAIELDNHHSLHEENNPQALPLQHFKVNQTFVGGKQGNDDALEPCATWSVSQVIDANKDNEGTSVSPLDNTESSSNNHKEHLVLCRCLTLSEKCAEQLRSVFQLSIMKNCIFVIFLVSHMFYAFGYYIPFVYIPVYAESIGIDIDLAAWIISALGITSTISRVISGFLSDLPNVNRLYLYSASLLICGVASTLVPLCGSFPLLMAYACIFGLFSGVTLTLISVLLVDLVGIDLLSEAFGIISLVEGVTSLAGPPLAGWLFDRTGNYTISFIMTGISIAVSGLTLLIIPCIQRRRKQGED
ncbi:hypothetical protein ACJMK2_017962 [Sinanodonta woodiana]|uniref:Major facilitator superfamily (MFS) profile domain-containing protein n=1 Tax=Sinanodonta woodiana TaxID=1069815 RepID=A0ABD3UC20_SINWO